jgi:gamma-glutamyltranspeptidase / glutathione hydrolase
MTVLRTGIKGLSHPEGARWARLEGRTSDSASMRNDFLAASFAGMLALVLAPDGAVAASLPAVEAAHGIVVSAQRRASEVGLRVLAEGGNAVDAAVAVGYALAVVDPCCGNIGGGGFMTLHLADGRERVVDFRETAPAAATARMYLDAQGRPIPRASLDGWRAAAVPGTVMGLDRALSEYGSMPRAAIMAPAVALARGGFVLDRSDAADLARAGQRLGHDPEAARIFLGPGGKPLEPGDRLVQKDLAATLEAIAARGPDAFYQGPIAAPVAKASAAGGGILTAADLAHYSAAETPPLACAWHGYRILSAPPPSSGGVAICEILGIVAGDDLKAMGFHSAASVHLLAEAMRLAYADRNAELGDPAFVKNPLDRLLSPDYAAELRARIDHRGNTAPLPPAAEKAETTHYSVVDGKGNAVAVTYTLNGGFGAGVVAPGTGFLLNDEMDDFTTAPGTANLYGLVQGEANATAPGKRPLSSMAPTIVEKDGQVVLVLGSPGGSRIITTVLETILNVLVYGMAPQQAVDMPRFHYQGLPDLLYYEEFGLSPDTLGLLRGMGYKPVMQKPWGAVELIAIANGRLYGASDSRRPEGAAMGY